MKNPNFMPQNSRFEAILLGCLGGALDIYCHMRFGTLVATQTGNLLFLIAELGHSPLRQTLVRLLSVIFFSLGFLLGLVIKNHAKTAFWRPYAILPLLITTLALPLLPNTHFLWVILLALSTGMVILTFSGSQIESHAYAIMMTSGNYRKMLTAWYQCLTTKNPSKELKRKAANYSLVVGSFILGAIITVILDSFLKARAIWLVSLLLVLILYHYTSVVVREGLKFENV